jgi:hypothetical protein
VNNETTDEVRPSRGVSFFTWAWMIGAVLFIYVTSTGPILKLASIGKVPKSTCYIYYPLHIATNGTPIEDLLKWYIGRVWKVDID